MRHSANVVAAGGVIVEGIPNVASALPESWKLQQVEIYSTEARNTHRERTNDTCKTPKPSFTGSHRRVAINKENVNGEILQKHQGNRDMKTYENRVKISHTSCLQQWKLQLGFVVLDRGGVVQSRLHPSSSAKFHFGPPHAERREGTRKQRANTKHDFILLKR